MASAIEKVIEIAANNLFDNASVQTCLTAVTDLSNNLDTRVNAVIDGAPGALNTLNELAAALGDDSNYATTVTNSLASKAVTGADASFNDISANDVSGVNFFTIGGNFIGDLVGNANTATTAGTVTTAAQSNITSVGTLTGLVVSGDISGNDASFNVVDIKSLNLSGTTLAFGIGNGNVIQCNASVADDDFLRIDGTNIEGRTAVEVLVDIAAAPLNTVNNVTNESKATMFSSPTFTGSVTMSDVSGNDASFNNVDINSIGAFTLKGHIIPDVDDTYDIGSSTKTIRDLYLGPNSLYVNGKQILHDNNNTITFSTTADQNLDVKTSGNGILKLQAASGGITTTSTGNVSLTSTGTGNIALTTTGDGDITLNSDSGQIELKTNIEITENKTISSSVAGGNVKFADNIQMLGSNKLIGDVSGNVTGTVSALSNHDTGDLTEGSNQYFTNARARSALSAGTGVTLSAGGQISIGQAVTTTSNVTFNNVNVQGELTMSGTATKINSTNTDISDNLILLNSNLNVVNPNDSGILINRGTLDPSNNAFMGWDESVDKFVLGTTAANGNSIGNLNITPAPLIVSDISGNDASFNVVDIKTLKVNGQDVTGGGGVPTTITVGDESSVTTCFPLFTTGATGDLGPKTGSNLTFNSSTGNLTATSFTGDVSGNANTVTNGVYTTSKINALAATSSSELAGVISDETGSGSLVFATSPALTSPTITGNVGIGTSLPRAKLDISGGHLLIGDEGNSDVSANGIIEFFTKQDSTGDKAHCLIGTLSDHRYPTPHLSFSSAIVSWETGDNIVFSGDEINRNQSSSDGWSYGYVHSKQQINTSSTHYQGVRWQITAAQAISSSGGSMVGLGKSTTWPSSDKYDDINYCMFDYGATQYIYESGTAILWDSAYSTQATIHTIYEIRINPITQKIEYLYDNKVVYESDVSVSYPLWVKVSLGKGNTYINSGIRNVKIVTYLYSANLLDSGLPDSLITENIQWGPTYNPRNYVTINPDNSIVASEASEAVAWAATAESTQLIYKDSTRIQGVKWKRNTVSTFSYVMCGLTNVSNNISNYGDIDIAIYQRKNDSNPGVRVRRGDGLNSSDVWDMNATTTSNDIFEIRICPPGLGSGSALNTTSSDIFQFFLNGVYKWKDSGNIPVTYPLKFAVSIDTNYLGFNGGNEGIKDAEIYYNPYAKVAPPYLSLYGPRTNFISSQYNFNITDISANNGKHGYSALTDVVSQLSSVDSALYINSKKNVGIGTTTPIVKLDIDGMVYANGSQLTSDDRIKHNEQNITNALDIIQQLTPKHYFKTKELYDASHNFVLDPSGNPLNANGDRLILHKDYKLETGIIAQEIKKIESLQFTVTHGNNSFYVDYNSIYCTHIAATKELHQILIEEQTKLTAAETKLAAAEAKIVTLETENTTLKARLDAVETRLNTAGI